MRLSNNHAALLSWSGAIVAMGIPSIVCHLVLLWSIPSVVAFSAVSSSSSSSVASIASSSRWLVLYDHHHHSGSGGGPRFITRLQDSTEAPSDSASLDDTDDDSDYRAQGYGTTAAATTSNHRPTTTPDDDTNRHSTSSRASMISQIFDLLPPHLSTSTGGGSRNNFLSFLDSNSHANEQQRATINEAIYQLEALGSSSGGSTTTPVTSSPLLNGVWELKYVGGYTLDGALPSPTRQLALFLYSGGYSPGVRIFVV
jgi:hypothetical protein